MAPIPFPPPSVSAIVKVKLLTSTVSFADGLSIVEPLVSELASPQASFPESVYAAEFAELTVAKEEPITIVDIEA